MEKHKLQRIVGILVLVSLVVIVLPILANWNAEPLPPPAVSARVANSTPVPAQEALQEKVIVASAISPDSPSLPVASSSPVADRKSNLPADVIPVMPPVRHSVAVTEKQNSHQLKHQHLCVVQLGNFRNRAYALRLVKRLKASGYHAFIREVSIGNGESRVRVYAGSKNMHEAKAHEMAREISKRMHLPGIVVAVQG